jgi:hypothetical protein
MSKEEVSTLFPGGTTSTLQSGTVYSLAREVSGFPTVTAFIFTAKRLSRVTLQFHREIDATRVGQGDTVQATPDATAKIIYDSLLSDLTAKYGTGNPLPRLGNQALGWETSDTQIAIATIKVPARPGFSITLIEYTPRAVQKKKAKQNGRWQEL